jgi:AcrR family transcriptional regulator
VVGERGARTRQLIVETTLDLFASQGFHDTSVDDIANAAGISRATLYQYFESKDQIVVELLEECGADLVRVIRRLGQLGPTAEGFDNLHWWLGEWAWVYDKYAIMFRQWAHIESPRVSVPTLVSGFVESYESRIAERLSKTGFSGPDLAGTASALLVVVHRVNYFRHSEKMRPVINDEVLLDTLAVILQQVLFPDTPARVLKGPHRIPVTSSQPRPMPRYSLDHGGPSERFSQLSTRAGATVRQLLDAAAGTFAERGYRLSYVDHIVEDAGLARGTFYKYFKDKLDLLNVLSEEAAQQLLQSAEDFAVIRPGPREPQALREWLQRFVDIYRQYAGVIRVWSEDDPAEESVQRGGTLVFRGLASAFERVFSQVKRPYPLDFPSASLVLVALLDRLPAAMHEQSHASEPQLIEIMAEFIERGLLNGRPVRVRVAS